MIFMINFEQRNLLHKLLLLDLAIKSLQHDHKHVEQCKMKSVFLPTIDALLKQLSKEYFQLKYQLARQNIKFISWQSINEHFVDVQIATAGNDQVLQYANKALKAQVEQLIIQHLEQ